MVTPEAARIFDGLPLIMAIDRRRQGSGGTNVLFTPLHCAAV